MPLSVIDRWATQRHRVLEGSIYSQKCSIVVLIKTYLQNYAFHIFLSLQKINKMAVNKLPHWSETTFNLKHMLIGEVF